MGKPKGTGGSPPKRKRSAPLTPEAQENRMIALAMEQAEEQLLNHTAPAQVVVHYLKLGSTKDRLEKEILAEQKKLVQAKTENLQSSAHLEAMMQEAMDAMKRYSGSRGADDDTELY